MEETESELEEAKGRASELSRRVEHLEAENDRANQLVESLRDELKTLNESYRLVLDQLEYVCSQLVSKLLL